MGCKEAKRLPTRRRRFSASAAADFVFLIPEDQIIQIPVIRKPTKSSVHTLPPFCDLAEYMSIQRKMRVKIDGRASQSLPLRGEGGTAKP